MNKTFHIALVGNPNSGKTTLFNRLTGTQQQVANWPGVTVERKTGRFTHSGSQYKVTDLPGTFSLHVEHGEDSVDQQIAQHFVLSREADLLVNVIDASSLERGLYLSSQLFDANVPMIIALNMVDVADAHGVHVDHNRLSQRLGCPVVPIIASRGEGIKALLDVIASQVSAHGAPPARLTLDSRLETVLRTIQSELGSSHNGPNGRLLASAVLERDAAVMARFDEPVRHHFSALVDELETQIGGRAGDMLIADRYRAIGDVCAEALQLSHGPTPTLTDRIDAIVLNRWIAFPLFLTVMYLMFVFTINIGGAFIDFFDISAAALVVELPRMAMEAIGLPQWLIALLADGVGGGVQLVASFVPVIAALFLFQSFLEDSGYMARSAFILDRAMRAFGLPGKSFVPLIVGFGCNVPSIMATRSLDTHQDRLLTSMMAPFMSCGARLTVYALFAAALFPSNGQNVVFALYLIGIALAVLTGWLMRRSLMNRDLSPFILELPAYHMPSLRGLFIHTWYRLKGFVLRAGKAIVTVVVILNFVNSLGVDGSFGNQDSERSALSAIGRAITPVFEPIGVREENWPATVGIFTGIFAKEVVVGTLDALYTGMADPDALKDDEVSISAMLLEGWDSIGTNLSDIGSQLADPLGLNIGDLSDAASAAEEQAVQVGTLTLMAELFDGQLGAFSYILFVLLYMPCVATLGAIFKEMGGFWAFFSATWNTVLAYSLAVIVYQSGQTVSATSLGWIAAAVVLVVSTYTVLIRLSRRKIQNSSLIPVLNI